MRMNRQFNRVKENLIKSHGNEKSIHGNEKPIHKHELIQSKVK